MRVGKMRNYFLPIKLKKIIQLWYSFSKRTWWNEHISIFCVIVYADIALLKGYLHIFETISKYPMVYHMCFGIVTSNVLTCFLTSGIFLETHISSFKTIHYHFFLTKCLIISVLELNSKKLIRDILFPSFL